jgi:acylphosphatase
MPVAYLLIVTGRVQGVGFRARVYEIALRSQITGYVRNMDDGRVEILAQAPDEEVLSRFIDSIKSVGPPARVGDVKRSQVGFSDRMSNFRIVH